jgi:hypothetical protein
MEPISRRMGNGSDTLFWSSNWIGGTPLAVTFPRLFSLCNQKDNLVVDLLEVYEERRSVVSISLSMGGRACKESNRPIGVSGVVPG